MWTRLEPTSKKTKQGLLVRWHTLVIQALEKLRQEDGCKLEASLGYTMRSCLKKQNKIELHLTKLLSIISKC